MKNDIKVSNPVNFSAFSKQLLRAISESVLFFIFIYLLIYVFMYIFMELFFLVCYSFIYIFTSDSCLMTVRLFHLLVFLLQLHQLHQHSEVFPPCSLPRYQRVPRAGRAVWPRPALLQSSGFVQVRVRPLPARVPEGSSYRVRPFFNVDLNFI